MKMSIKGLSVLLAILVSVLIVQSVQATDLEGTVITVDHTTILLDTSEKPVFGLGPKSYWRDKGFVYPKEGDYLYLDVYEGQSHFIAVEVCYGEDNRTCIELRDPDTLIPLWLGFQTTVTTDSTVTTSECPNSNCPGCEPILNSYNWEYLEPGPHKK